MDKLRKCPNVIVCEQQGINRGLRGSGDNGNSDEATKV